MSSGVLPSGKADVTNHTDETPAGGQHPVAHAPDIVELFQKLAVVLDPAQLALAAAIFLECPVRRRRHHQVDRPAGKLAWRASPNNSSCRVGIRRMAASRAVIADGSLASRGRSRAGSFRVRNASGTKASSWFSEVILPLSSTRISLSDLSPMAMTFTFSASAKRTAGGRRNPRRHRIFTCDEEVCDFCRSRFRLTRPKPVIEHSPQCVQNPHQLSLSDPSRLCQNPIRERQRPPKSSFPRKRESGGVEWGNGAWGPLPDPWIPAFAGMTD